MTSSIWVLLRHQCLQLGSGSSDLNRARAVTTYVDCIQGTGSDINFYYIICEALLIKVTSCAVQQLQLVCRTPRVTR